MKGGRTRKGRMRVTSPGRRWWLAPAPDPVSILLVLGLITGLALGSALPGRWVQARAAMRMEAWFLQAAGMAERLGQASLSATWFEPGDLGGFRDGPLERLATHPLNAVLVHGKTGTVWVREGGTFVQAPPSPEILRLRASGLEAFRRRDPWWLVSPAHGRSPEASAAWVLDPGSDCAVLKVWRPGSPEVDQFLERASRGWLPVRIGLVPTSAIQALQRRHPDLDSWCLAAPFGQGGSPAPLQITRQNLSRPFGVVKQGTRLCSEGWTSVIAPTRETLDLMERSWRSDRRIAWCIYALAGLLAMTVTGALLAIIQRRAVDARRMAALAHSLKTPLALMKIRCDSARNEALPRSRRDANLLRINDGLDQLLEMIENGLEAFRPGRGRIPRAEVGAAFFTALEEELLPALEAEGRPLVVDLAAGPFRANPGALRAGLSILLENALIHGQGEIRLSTRRRGRLVEVAVSDEGRGIPAVALTGMLHGGTPPEGKPAPIRPSQGLGLHLLYSLATREAWGLVFHTEPGFQVVLEVQAR